jgi:hypothetical protein
MVHLLSTKEKLIMARNYKDYSYFENRPDVVRIFDDLEAFQDFCRLELREFNPAELYKKDAPNYGAYLASKRPRRPYLGKNPRWDNNGRRNEQNFSR